jgi:murein L,D-transpeptidase YcbB/YkuD
MNALHKRFLLVILLTIPLLANQNTSTYVPNDVVINTNLVFSINDQHILKNQVMLQNFYQQRQNRAVWLTDNWKIKGAKVMNFLEYIKKDLTLNPHGYIKRKGQEVTKNLEQRHTKEGLISLDLQLSSLYYDFLQHTIYGEIDWKRFERQLEDLKKATAIDYNWVRYPFKFDIISLMSQDNIPQTLYNITPKGYGYQGLIKSLRELYVVKWKGGWNKLPPFKSIKKGYSGPIVKQLRERLKFSKDYRWCKNTSNGNNFDACLESAVKRFQRRHGLIPDGIVGKGTQVALNKPVQEEIEKVLLNIDRIKWLPRIKSDHYINVNIPEYMLHYFEYGQEIQQLKVIVGDKKHPTPIFSDEISYITVNPYWKIPEGILKREVIPAMLKNPNYIKKQGLEIHSTWEENSSIIPENTIDWQKYSDGKEKFPYRLMQPPGERNALGKIKFKFPNNFSVYLHDTPSKHLFRKKTRAFSHGCIRLSKPFSLLKTISYDPSIDLQEINNVLKEKKKQDVILTYRIPINIIYLTAWVNQKGELIFGDDIYSYDKYQQRLIK